MTPWIRRQFHELMAAFWQHQIEVARVEHDWIALSYAIDRRNHHDTQLIHQALREQQENR